MITDEQIKRINELARKSKESGLNDSEKDEQARLRALYIKSMKQSLTSQLDNTYIIDEKGNKRKIKRKKQWEN